MPRMGRRVTLPAVRRPDLLQVPESPVGIEDEGPASLGEVLEPDLTPHALVRGPPAAQRITAAVRTFTHEEVRVLAGPLEIEEPGEHRV
jgi:hypothetical protein